MVRRKKTTVKFIIILALLFLSFYGCHPLQSSLPGVYISNEKNVVDSVFLYNNFQYIHKVVVRDSLKTQKGRWEYSYGTIQLHDFKTFMHNLPIDSSIRSSDVDISFKGVIEIEINSDSDINYVKVK
ncbi:hypothetical protein [Mucilaginibacter glaciei]|uniref:Lipoprotein n=1 Tax=Mucilaginibacter glaciei TaxID=2772109 RepID=A0A926NST7_9SPHI|nr:hypothetical protein [Mucilaginibacter glaciei]MBD1393967.1 hypothetical protein [Mucilaginibacter glaciei]